MKEERKKKKRKREKRKRGREKKEESKMDQHVLEFTKSLSDIEIDREYYNYLIKKIKEISNNNIKGFMNKISKNKNRISDVDKTLLLIPSITHSKKISQKDKLIIFYYVYHYHNKVLNNELINMKQKRKMLDIEYKKPNSYIGYYKNEAYQIKILIDEDSDMTKVYKNYKIMELYGIPLPDMNLDYRFGNEKSIVISKNRKINNKDDKKFVFLQILNILRIFNNNKFFVFFDFWNIRNIKDRYYLLNLRDIRKVNKLNTKKQIDLLINVLEYKIPNIKYDYDTIFRNLII